MAKHVAILGSGVMGKQLALLCASANNRVTIWNHHLKPELDSDFRRMANIESRRGIISKESVPLILQQIHHTDDLSLISSADIVIETIVEDLVAKRKLLLRLSEFIGDQTIVTSNTSTLSINGLADQLPYSSRFLGVHFFNPALSIKLVEVVCARQTRPDSRDRILEILSNFQKHPVVMSETPGNVVNRLLFSLINEAVHFLGEGIVDAHTIDSCMKLGALHPMGPLELADFIGLDVTLKILETLSLQTNNPKFLPSKLLIDAVKDGRLGRKSGAGFYNYRKQPV